MTTSTEAAGPRDIADSTRLHVVVALTVVWVAAPLVLAAFRWPRYWVWIASEESPMTWLESVVLVLCAASCLLVAYVTRLSSGPVHRLRWRDPATAWAVLALGFSGLAFDERFSVHERIRDSYLAPRGVRIPFLPWVAPGDFLLLLVAVVGLAILPLVWACFRGDRLAVVLMITGIGLALVAVALDSIDPSSWTVGQERVQQSLEEVIELGSGLSFLGAAVVRLLDLLRLRAAPSSG